MLLGPFLHIAGLRNLAFANEIKTIQHRAHLFEVNKFRTAGETFQKASKRDALQCCSVMEGVGWCSGMLGLLFSSPVLKRSSIKMKKRALSL